MEQRRRFGEDVLLLPGNHPHPRQAIAHPDTQTAAWKPPPGLRRIRCEADCGEVQLLWHFRQVEQVLAIHIYHLNMQFTRYSNTHCSNQLPWGRGRAVSVGAKRCIRSIPCRRVIFRAYSSRK